MKLRDRESEGSSLGCGEAFALGPNATFQSALKPQVCAGAWGVAVSSVTLMYGHKYIAIRLIRKNLPLLSYFFLFVDYLMDKHFFFPVFPGTRYCFSQHMMKATGESVSVTKRCVPLEDCLSTGCTYVKHEEYKV